MNTHHISLTQTARLGQTFGYRCTADQVELNATVAVAAAGAHDCAWSLQLWAHPGASTDAAGAGFLVAEAALPPLAEFADTAEPVFVHAPARPPAGDRDYALSLALVAHPRGGESRVEDSAGFARREQFDQPRLSGAIGFRVDGDRVQVTVQTLLGRRDARNLSGSLALELWALPAAYAGGEFAGRPVTTSAQLGQLGGQEAWSNLNLPLVRTAELRAGDTPVLMLREWNGAGFVTVDFTNFAPLPATAAATAVAAESAVEAVVEVGPETRAEPAVAAAPAADAPVAPAPAPIAAPAKPARRTTKSGKVSVNRASVEELAAVKGLPLAVAQRIVEQRPFKHFADLVNVRGLGEKLLARLRSLLEL